MPNDGDGGASTTEGVWPPLAWEERPWARGDDERGSRRQLLSARGPYRAAVPPMIAGAQVSLSATALSTADDAARDLARFDTEAGMIAAPFASILLRTESAASSEIEHLTSSAKQVALAELGASTSVNARLVVANVRAMQAAIDLADRLDEDSVIAMHRALLEAQSPAIVGRWRQEQVWVGGGSLSPHNADFVAPHHERVPALMADLMAFARRTDVPALAQVAIAHAQFETIHPFPDGNGRTGRALIQGMLRASGVTRSVTVPVSAGLLHDTEEYFRALTEYRAGHPERIIEVVAEASFAAVTNGRRLVADINAARARWDAEVKARSDSSVHRLKDVLLRQPVIDVRAAAQLLRVSEVAAQSSINRLVDARVLTQSGGGRRNRRWQADEVLAALDAFGARAKRGR